jgi:hypothetical protein
MLILIIALLLIVCWLFSAFIIYLAARCTRESGALDTFLPTEQPESEKKDTKLLEAGTETDKDVEHD